jgi:hypothetical protein
LPKPESKKKSGIFHALGDIPDDLVHYQKNRGILKT